MSDKTKPKTDPNSILLSCPEEEKAQRAAQLILRPSINSATIIKAFNAKNDDIDINALITELSQQAKSVHDGNLNRVEAMLVAQAHTLDALFSDLVRRARLNINDYLDATDRFMRLGLKAQNQCRATLETLATIKNPPVVYAKQANIAQGNQQVNNNLNAPNKSFSIPLRAHAHTGKTESVQNKLLEDKQHETERVDFGTANQTSRSYTPMEALAEINRRENAER